MARRTVLFVIALVVALLATGSVFAYVSNVDDRAIADAEPVEVLVAKEVIAAGTSAQAASEKGLLTLSTLPRKSVPDGALSDIASVRALIAVSDIFPGEMLLRAKFAEQQNTGALTIPGDKLALAVELGDPERVAGFVVPGSEVAIFDTFEQEAVAGQPAVPQATRMLLARVPVIAVGPTTLRKSSDEEQDDEAASDEEPVARTVLTVAVTAREAEKLVHAAQTGKLYFALLSSKSATGNSKGVDNRTLFS